MVIHLVSCGSLPVPCIWSCHCFSITSRFSCGSCTMFVVVFSCSMFACGGSHGFHHSQGGHLSLFGSLNPIPVGSSMDSCLGGVLISWFGSSILDASWFGSVFW